MKGVQPNGIWVQNLINLGIWVQNLINLGEIMSWCTSQDSIFLQYLCALQWLDYVDQNHNITQTKDKKAFNYA